MLHLSQYTTCHSLAVEIDQPVCLFVICFRPVLIDDSVREPSELELVVDADIFRRPVELYLSAHKRIGVNAWDAGLGNIVRPSCVRRECRRMFRHDVFVVRRLRDVPAFVRLGFDVPPDRQRQIAYLRLCRLIVHMLLDVPCQHQDFAALPDDDVTFMNEVLPVCLEVRAGVRIADLRFPVHREVRRTDEQFLWYGRYVDDRLSDPQVLAVPVVYLCERLRKMRMV